MRNKCIPFSRQEFAAGFSLIRFLYPSVKCIIFHQYVRILSAYFQHVTSGVMHRNNFFLIVGTECSFLLYLKRFSNTKALYVFIPEQRTKIFNMITFNVHLVSVWQKDTCGHYRDLTISTPRMLLINSCQIDNLVCGLSSAIFVTSILCGLMFHCSVYAIANHPLLSTLCGAYHIRSPER